MTDSNDPGNGAETQTATLTDFLRLVHPDVVNGLIEVRVVGEARGSKKKLHSRNWYSGARDLLQSLPSLMKMAERDKAGIYCGVLRRCDRSSGKGTNLLPGSVVWCDLDFKDCPGGEPGTRARLAAFACGPSITIHTGHGLHAYWLLEGVHEPEIISALARGLKEALGGDHTHDASRVLRLPCTINWKDGKNGAPVIIEELHAERVWSAEQLRGCLPEPRRTEKKARKATRPDGALFDLDAELDPRILAQIDQLPSIRRLFEGRGKQAVLPNGKASDASHSGYDFSLAFALIRQGIVDPGLLANALANRPDGAARAKGENYIRRTIEQALTRFHDGEKHRRLESTDFIVDSVVVYVSDSRIYELTIEGYLLRLSTQELLSPRKFQAKFADKIGRIPTIPSGKDWRLLVNGWTAESEEVSLPPDASDEIALRDAVERAVRGLPIGEGEEDLDGEFALVADGVRLFKAEVVRRRLIEEWPDLARNELCRMLRVVGADNRTRRGVGPKPVRVWEIDEAACNAREERERTEEQEVV